MENLLNPLLKSLQRLLGLHRQLLDCVRAEKEAFRDANLKAIQEGTYAKEALIESIKGVEHERLKVMAVISQQLKKPLKDLTLPKLIIEVQGKSPALAEQLRTAYNALTVIIQRISEQNRYNHGLIEQSLMHLNHMKRNVLGESAPRSNTYSAQGQKVNGAGSSRLLSKEA